MILHSPTAPGSVILAAVNPVAVRCCAELFTVSHTFTLCPIKIGTSGTLLGTNATTCVGILDERSFAYVWTYAFAGRMVENLWATADNVLGTPALAAGRIYFEGTFADFFRALTVTGSLIENSRRKAKDWLTYRFALTVKLISDTQAAYTDWEPYNQTPTIEPPEYKNLEVSGDCLKRSACLSVWT